MCDVETRNINLQSIIINITLNKIVKHLKYYFTDTFFYPNLCVCFEENSFGFFFIYIMYKILIWILDSLHIPTAVYNDSTIQYILYDKYGQLTSLKGHYNCFV